MNVLPQFAHLSRRSFLAGVGALTLTVALRPEAAEAQAAITPESAATAPAGAPFNPFTALLQIRPDNTAFLQVPVTEGGQGIFTGLAQVVGEELDLDPARFVVQVAVPGPEIKALGSRLSTGGSSSMWRNFLPMRRMGATSRAMLMQAAAARLGVAVDTLSTGGGKVVHAASGKSFDYGDLAAEAAALPIPTDVALRSDDSFRWIGKSVPRIDMHDKSTGRVVYNIDTKVDGMLQAAVQHAPRLGMQPVRLLNKDAVEKMTGVHSVHMLPGCVAVVADRWWHARRAAEALIAEWKEAESDTPRPMPADFSTEKLREDMLNAPGPGFVAETAGDAASAMASASKTLEAVYDAPFLAHAQLEPPSAIASWNEADGSVELWLSNQAQLLFQNAAAKVAGVAPEKVTLHSPMLGGFFGRYFYYDESNPYPQAILLSKAVGRPIKVIWSREEEFLRDAFRPAVLVRFKAGLNAEGMPVALQSESVSDGLYARIYGASYDKFDPTVVEGIAKKVYDFPNRNIAHVMHRYPPMIGAWRSVGHSFNDFFMECFTDEMADAGKIDPFELRRRLVAHSPRHATLLQAVGDLSGGWRRGPFTADDGSRRARGIAMASPFGTEMATIAEVSIVNGSVKVHDIWVAIDPGRVINPAIVEAQMNSAVALGLSSALLEEVIYENGEPRARNYDLYPILPPNLMPRVHVRIVESGAPMTGVGEPGVPGVPPAVVNAVAALTGQRVRRLPLSRTSFGGNT
ncbi:xanthine dehydrogenase family protein molybdopterin-binding subunit [Rhizobium lusitanum]|uniref:xanthine dehydrogenase family protein molybdopterin-binding subunit n=1 Tax=Rhizobium lusitanum TaxID=293958 RepID=UPI001574CB52|nr:molybdopterin cofactor-binding domain-containing protein [Rhizobium lusitanum]NTJ11605.1 xanthine dehydrogenase family protein molybdopterin-binding subunit [Rhizobium lusitanum]